MVWQQVINVTPWGRQPKYLIRDRDAVYGREFRTKLAKVGVASVRTPIRAPRANSVAERVVRTIRQEALDHMIVLNERHLHAILSEFSAYYNHERPHRTLRMAPPVYRPRKRTGVVTARPVLGGLHHVYARAA